MSRTLIAISIVIFILLLFTIAHQAKNNHTICQTQETLSYDVCILELTR